MSKSTVSRVLARAGLSRLRDLEPSEPVLRYEHEHTGDLLHIDTKKLGRIERPSHRVTGNRRDSVDGAGWDFLFVAVDDHARIGFTDLYPDERKASAVQFLRNTVPTSTPWACTSDACSTDNGSAFRSKAFAKACRRLGLKHSFTRPYRPHTNGKAERFIQSALCEWAYGTVYNHSTERATILERWIHHYNWHRPHQGHRGPRANQSPGSVQKQPLDASHLALRLGTRGPGGRPSLGAASRPRGPRGLLGDGASANLASPSPAPRAPGCGADGERPPPTPTSCSRRVQARGTRETRGKLKIFFGACAGVGKTYAMLEAAREQRADGVDVVVGLRRDRTAATRPQRSSRASSCCPPQAVAYRGVDARGSSTSTPRSRASPALMLVDELAHTNAARLAPRQALAGRRGAARGRHRRLHDDERAAHREPQRRGRARSPAIARARDGAGRGVRRGATRSSWSTCRPTS